jgi:uncharacterized protein (DUF885 family)
VNKSLLIFPMLLAIGSIPMQPSVVRGQDPDAAFAKLADEYLQGYLEWRPQLGTALGFHQYDGKITDYSKASLDAELVRLQSFDRRLAELQAAHLSAQASYDYQILRGAIKREIFSFDQMQIYSQNPMTYAGAIDVNIYVKRNFAPLEDRVRSITAILNQSPKIFAAARANLAESLPRPQIEIALDQADGAVDFLSKDLVDALKQVNDEKVLADFKAADNRAIEELRGYVTYLKEQKSPKANDRYSLGRERHSTRATPGVGAARIAPKTGGLCRSGPGD